MKNPTRYTVPFRRKREGRTDYKKRLKLIASGMPRLVIRRTNMRIIAQIVIFNIKGDEVKVGVDSNALKKIGWKGSMKNLPAAYLTGYLIGKKALAAKVNEVVLDIGLITSIKGGKVFAALKGAVDSGLKVICSEEVFPNPDRIKGKHIKSFQNNIDEIKGKIK